jgi:hypothetical protein
MKNEIKASYMSAPADESNPGFDSLLSAMKAVHEGSADISLLKTYHAALTDQINESRSSILEMEISEGSQDTKNMSLGSLDIIGFMLDSIEIYIDTPTPENMGLCVNAYLDARAAAEYVHNMLDNNIAAAGAEKKED